MDDITTMSINEAIETYKEELPSNESLKLIERKLIRKKAFCVKYSSMGFFWNVNHLLLFSPIYWL